MASGLLLISLLGCVILSHNLLAASAREAFVAGGDTFENQKNYYGTPSTPAATPVHVLPAPKAPCLSGSKCSGHHRHHSTPRPSCGTPATPVTPSIPRPRVSSPIPRPTPVPTPVVVPPIVNPPVVLPPPSPISVPGTPTLPPFPFDPNTPPFTCDYWRNHPTIIWGLLGWWGTLGSAFGTTTLPGSSLPGLPGSSLPGLPGLPQPSDSLVQALSNTRNDGYGNLYREGVASFLNSVVDPSKFPLSTKQVRDSFVAALSSDKTAATQARVFKLANENKLHHD